MLKLFLKDIHQQVIVKSSGNSEVTLTYKHSYSMGDQFYITTDVSPIYLIVELDPCLHPALIYIPKKQWTYHIPFAYRGEWPYNFFAFKGRYNYAHIRVATPDEINAYQDLACNAYDQHEASEAYPHAYANAETRDEPVFWARNAIDGYLANTSHGSFPFQSWGIDGREDAEITVDFGRDVKLDKVGILQRADYPHDSYWKYGTIEFSDYTTLELDMQKSLDEQKFSFTPKITNSITLKNLRKDNNVPGFVALSEIRAYGWNI